MVGVADREHAEPIAEVQVEHVAAVATPAAPRGPCAGRSARAGGRAVEVGVDRRPVRPLVLVVPAAVELVVAELAAAAAAALRAQVTPRTCAAARRPPTTA